MYQKKIANTLTCGSVLTKEVLHGKWKSTLLAGIAQGIQRPSALQRMIPSASRRVPGPVGTVSCAVLTRAGSTGSARARRLRSCT